MVHSIIKLEGDEMGKSNEEHEKIINSVIQELRRGTISLAVLSQLKRPQYGYSLVVLMNERGFPLEANTLYPLLRRLEKQGLLTSFWDTDGTKPRKYYQLSEFGLEVYRHLRETWEDINLVMSQLMEEETS